MTAHMARHKTSKEKEDVGESNSGEEEDSSSSDDDDESYIWEGELSDDERQGGGETDHGLMLCEFSALREKVKVDFELLKGGGKRQGVIAERPEKTIPGNPRKLRIVEEGEKGKGRWHNYEKDFKSLDAVS